MAPTSLTGSYSLSPSKPAFLMAHLAQQGKLDLLDVEGEFAPYDQIDFLAAHTSQYVGKFFDGAQPAASSNSIPWSAEFADTVRYTNASLYEAIKHANAHPETVTFSPTSGFHHARPYGGMGFCTFSGQAIASIKLYREQGLRGAYLDLDGHFGNSIEDTRTFTRDMSLAVPPGCNVNVIGKDGSYVKNLERKLAKLRVSVLAGDVDYVVWCHGADSHVWDDLGEGCGTGSWLACADAFYAWVRDLDAERGRPLPVTLSLFGGYRKDGYASVLELHTADLARCGSILLGDGLPPYKPEVMPPLRFKTDIRY